MAVRAKQAPGKEVLSFAATPKEILQFAEIDRVSREGDGTLKGFQRHLIASHVKEIRDYLADEKALLPNPIVLAFISGIEVRPLEDGLAEVVINADAGKPGFVVDGQQRLTALSGLDKGSFQVFVSTLVCKDYDELRQQFVLINNTRPLPKALIYELLPTVTGLPERYTARSFAARLVDLLNYTEGSSLHGLIYQHTNPGGVIRDTAVQKLIMNSASDGAIRQMLREEDYVERAYQLVNEFFWGVRRAFEAAWEDMTPKTSRLVHGAGIVAIGYLMELLYSRSEARTRSDFETGLKLLENEVAWTSGVWRFSEDSHVPWNDIQNTSADIDRLANYLVRELKRKLRLQAVERLQALEAAG